MSGGYLSGGYLSGGYLSGRYLSGGYLWVGTLEMLWTLKSSTVSKKNDWTCDTCSATTSHQSAPPTLIHLPNRSMTTTRSTLTESGTRRWIGSWWWWYRSKSYHLNPITPASRTTPQCERTVPMVMEENCWSSFTDR